MKRVLLILISVVALAAFGCSRRAQEGLGQFVGTWKTMYTLLDSRGGRVSSGTLTVKQPSADTVSFGESSSVITGAGQFGVNRETRSFEVALKQSASSYLLSLKIDGEGILNELPLTYSASDGFNGQGSVSLGGKLRPVSASIKRDGAGYIWRISADESSGPKYLYEFTFKEKS